MTERQKSLLVVDDNELVRKSLNLILEQHGYHVFCAASAEEACEFFKTRRFDIVVTDYNMSGMNGVEFATILKETLEPPYPKIVLMSGDPPPIPEGSLILHSVRKLTPTRELIQLIKSL